MSRDWPPIERYSLTSQIRRSSRAVGGLVAEAWARRRYTPAFVNTVNQALGEATETQAWLDQAYECGYIDDTTLRQMDSDWEQIGGMLQRMIDRADTFAPRSGAPHK